MTLVVMCPRKQEGSKCYVGFESVLELEFHLKDAMDFETQITALPQQNSQSVL